MGTLMEIFKKVKEPLVEERIPAGKMKLRRE